MTNKLGLYNIGFQFLAVLLALLFTTIILILSDAPPLEAYKQILLGSIGSFTKISDVLVVWVPLLLVTSGLLVTFTAGLWNIGIEGQITLGAIFTTSVLRMFLDSNLPPWLIILLGIQDHRGHALARALDHPRSGFRAGRAVLQGHHPGGLPGRSHGHPDGHPAVHSPGGGRDRAAAFTSFNNSFFSTNLNGPLASLTVTIFQYAMGPYEDWHRQAWAASFVITLFILGLTVTGRALLKWRYRK